MTGWVANAAIVSAPAKINLSLRVVGRRSDGYHLLDSVVAPISLFDDIRLDVHQASTAAASICCAPLLAAPSDMENLAAKAALRFMWAAGVSAHVAIDLTKRIPSGAGLGGGSSDAAAVLRGLNSLLGTPLSQSKLMAIGLELGADVPLFVFGRPARMRGIGELLEACEVRAQPLVVAFAGGGLSTPEVYAKYDDLLTMSGLAGTIRPPALGHEPPRTMYVNDLEAAAFHIDPALRSLKERLRTLGAQSVAMTGSGAAVFGICNVWEEAQAAAERLRDSGIWAHAAHILETIPAVELVAER